MSAFLFQWSYLDCEKLGDFGNFFTFGFLYATRSVARSGNQPSDYKMPWVQTSPNFSQSSHEPETRPFARRQRHATRHRRLPPTLPENYGELEQQTYNGSFLTIFSTCTTVQPLSPEIYHFWRSWINLIMTISDSFIPPCTFSLHWGQFRLFHLTIVADIIHYAVKWKEWIRKRQHNEMAWG